MDINKPQEGHVGKRLCKALAGDFMSLVGSRRQIDLFPFGGMRGD